jgi:hypothetical protein
LAKSKSFADNWMKLFDEQIKNVINLWVDYRSIFSTFMRLIFMLNKLMFSLLRRNWLKNIRKESLS